MKTKTTKPKTTVAGQRLIRSMKGGLAKLKATKPPKRRPCSAWKTVFADHSWRLGDTGPTLGVYVQHSPSEERNFRFVGDVNFTVVAPSADLCKASIEDAIVASARAIMAARRKDARKEKGNG